MTQHQASSLTGFVMDPEEQGYFTNGTNFGVVVDGFSNMPTVFENVIVVFDQTVPTWCQPAVFIGGNPALYLSSLGWFCPIGNLTVTTPTPWGKSFSDTMTLDLLWQNCWSIRIYAFSDANYNFARDGGECFSAFSHDTAVPTRNTTWGRIKALYSD